MIELRSVVKRYGHTVAVDDVTMSISEGTLTVLLGPSGCGKTTTIRAINRMVEIDEGSILIDGADIRHRDPNELRRHIGYVIQSVGLFPHMSVARNIATVPRLLGWSERRTSDRVVELLELLGLDPGTYMHKKPAQLSGGEAQRVGVARALAADPPVLLLDEPFGALDPLTRAHLQKEFVRLQRLLRKTVLFVTHDVEEALAVADSIALMRDGRLVQHGPPEDLWLHPADDFVRSFFGDALSLKMLARYPVSGLPLQDVCGDGKPSVSNEATLKDAVTAMLSSGSDRVSVTDAEGRHLGTLSFSALARLVRGSGD